MGEDSRERLLREGLPVLPSFFLPFPSPSLCFSSLHTSGLLCHFSGSSSSKSFCIFFHFCFFLYCSSLFVSCSVLVLPHASAPLLLVFFFYSPVFSLSIFALLVSACLSSSVLLYHLYPPLYLLYHSQPSLPLSFLYFLLINSILIFSLLFVSSSLLNFPHLSASPKKKKKYGCSRMYLCSCRRFFFLRFYPLAFFFPSSPLMLLIPSSLFLVLFLPPNFCNSSHCISLTITSILGASIYRLTLC